MLAKLTPGREISTHAPAGGATRIMEGINSLFVFLLTPLREGRQKLRLPVNPQPWYFYSRPCGRGDSRSAGTYPRPAGFLLTPLREGRRREDGGRAALLRYFYSRPCGRGDALHGPIGCVRRMISTHAPAGGATSTDCAAAAGAAFLLTPLREGRR